VGLPSKKSPVATISPEILARTYLAPPTRTARKDLKLWRCTRSLMFVTFAQPRRIECKRRSTD
jgi:hypothetical protein